MNFYSGFRGAFRALCLILITLRGTGIAQEKDSRQSTTGSIGNLPSPEALSYRIEWRMVTAGAAKLRLIHDQSNWQIHLDLQSAGLVSRLFRIEDTYKATVTDQFCGLNSNFEAQEGKRHILETQTFDYAKKKDIFELHDMVKNQRQHDEIDIPPCTHEIVGALEALRELSIEPGRAITMPIANGKKMAYAKIQAERRENLKLNGHAYSTVRYEAFIFDNVLFRRKGLLLVWVSEEAPHLPVQMQFQMGFPIGNITVELEKVERI